MPVTQKKGSFFLGTMVGFLIGCVACAALALFITNAPIPFVEKVQKQSTPVDAAALDGKDPNAALYDSGTRGTPADDALSAIKTVQAPTAHEQAEEPVNAADQATGESYTIQAGAFRNAKDAEKILVKSTDAGITLYRVFLGPFDTAREANELQQRLTSNGFDAMVIKNK